MKSSLDEALETLNRVRERALPEMKQDVDLYTACLRTACPDARTAEELLRGIASLIEQHPAKELSAEIRRIARRVR